MGHALCFQDEARVGQKNKITRRWAKRGTRPRAPHDQRTRSAYIFGAICPARGVGAALGLPRCNTQAMQWHLVEISSQVTPGAHAVILLDQAGWHTTHKLDVPENITLMRLPPRSPELNPVENIRQFMRYNWLSIRAFKSYADIVDHSCFAWNSLYPPAMENHVHRCKNQGHCIILNTGWYYPVAKCFRWYTNVVHSLDRASVQHIGNRGYLATYGVSPRGRHLNSLNFKRFAGRLRVGPGNISNYCPICGAG